MSEGGDPGRAGICSEEPVSFKDVDTDSWLPEVAFEFERVEWSALILRTSSSVRSSQVNVVGFDGSVEIITIQMKKARSVTNTRRGIE